MRKFDALGDLVRFRRQSHSRGSHDSPTRLLGLINEVEEDDELRHEVVNDGTEGDADGVLAVSEVLDVGSESEELRREASVWCRDSGKER